MLKKVRNLYFKWFTLQILELVDVDDWLDGFLLIAPAVALGS
jgi:hypothetical protein